MDHDAFPRQDRLPRFDLRERKPQKEDRRVRDDDRQLFLDAMLCARDVFYVSYVGCSAETNHELPPSVVVSERHSFSTNA